MKKLVLAFVLALAAAAATGSFSTAASVHTDDPLPYCPPICSPLPSN